MNRCINCGSSEIRFAYESDEYKCMECGAIEDVLIEAPELDELDDMLAYFADAPLGEAPALTPIETLTPREREVAALVAMGLSNKAIAAHDGVSFHTVKKHIFQIFMKLRIENRTQLALLMMGKGEAA